jgi:hypothetical protein
MPRFLKHTIAVLTGIVDQPFDEMDSAVTSIAKFVG